MELRLKTARATVDIDLALQSGVLPNTKEGEANQILREMIQKAASAPLDDWFAYSIGHEVMDLDAAPSGGARYPVEARMDARIFARFHLDVGIGDPVMKPLETVEGSDWLQFAGIAAPPFRTIPQEQQIAEKLHAYTLPRSTPNSRVKDLIDLLLLIRSGKVAMERIAEAVRVTFERRKTHSLPSALAPPPEGWSKQFSELARECKTHEDMEETFAKVQAFFRLMVSDWQK